MWLPEKPRLPLCLVLWLPARQSSGASPVYGRRELEAGPEVWPDQRLKPLTAKGKGFLEFGAWEVHLGLQYRKGISRAIFIHLGPVSSWILYSYAPIFAAKGLKMPYLGFPQHVGTVVLLQWSSSVCYCWRHWDNLESTAEGGGQSLSIFQAFSKTVS